MRTNAKKPSFERRTALPMPLVMALAGMLLLLPAIASSAGFTPGGFGLREEESRFFPGTYYFHKGCEAFARGKATDAIRLWQQAAGWGHKAAQYDLGIAYYKGQGIPVDRPRGIAWLALASERNEEQFQQSFDAAWFEASDEERSDAQRIHAELKPVYADATALKKAARRYEDERRAITGSRVGAPGHVVIYAGGSRIGQDATRYLADVERAADTYFTTGSGSVRIGPLLLEEEPATQDPGSRRSGEAEANPPPS